MKKQPNILMISSDQHRLDCVGYTNVYPVKTPNIDQLAKEGVIFNKAYTPIPLCCPARQALLSGRRPEAFGSLWNYDFMDARALEPEAYVWPRALHEGGYQTSYIGKWHVNPDHGPLDFGYDNYIGLEHYEAFVEKKYPNRKFENGFFGEIDPVELEDARTHWQAEKAIDAMEAYAESDTPWHIRLDYVEPHLPCRPVKEFADRYALEDVVKWDSFDEMFENKPFIQKQQLVNWKIEDMTWDDWVPVVSRYYAIISQMDDAIGRVLTKLKELGLEEDTIVIYTTDHGDMCGGHRMMDKHYVMYDDIVRVPFIVKWSGMYEPHEVEDYVYNYLDLAPTIVDWSGVPGSPEFAGRPLQPLLKGEQVDDWRDAIISTYNGQQFGLYTSRMFVQGRYKYIWNATDVDELYDLDNDVGELKNIINNSQHKVMVADYRKQLYNTLLKEGDTLMESPWIKDALLDNRKYKRVWL